MSDPTRSLTLDDPVTSLDVSPRLFHAFDGMGLKTIGDLMEVSDAEWLRTPKLGHKSIAQLKAELLRVGLRPNGTDDDIPMPPVSVPEQCTDMRHRAGATAVDGP